MGRKPLKISTLIWSNLTWPPDAKNWLIWKDSDAGKDWRLEKKETTEDGMVGWHHWLNGHEFGWTLGVGDGQGSLACCNSWGRKESDMTEQLNWTELNWWMKKFPGDSCVQALVSVDTVFHGSSFLGVSWIHSDAFCSAPMGSNNHFHTARCAIVLPF